MIQQITAKLQTADSSPARYKQSNTGHYNRLLIGVLLGTQAFSGTCFAQCEWLQAYGQKCRQDAPIGERENNGTEIEKGTAR